MKLHHKTIVLDDGLRVGVSTAGQLRDVPLVFLHGMSVSSVAYEELLERLAVVGGEVVAIDAVDHGRTDSLPWGHTVGDMVDVTRRTLDQLGIERAIFVGHSMGGGMIVEFAARHPQRVVAAVLLDAAAGAEHHESIRVSRSPRIMLRSAQKLAGAFMDVFGDLALSAQLRTCRGQLELLRTLRKSMSGFRFVKAAYALMQADTVPLLPLMKARDIPIAFIHGEWDQIVPLAAAESAAELANADLYVVHGAFHSWMLADPVLGAELIDLALSDFFRVVA